MNTNPAADLYLILSGWLRRYRTVRALSWAAYGILFGLALSLGFTLAGLVGGILLEEEVLWLTSITTILSAALSALAGYAWKISTQRAAITFDRQFSLQERISTALELAERGNQSELARQQLTDALEYALKVDARQFLKAKVRRLDALMAFILIVGLLLSLQMGQGRFQLIRQQRLVQQAIQAESIALQELISQVQNNPELSPQDRQALLETIKNAQAELNDANTIEGAVSTLSQTSEQLQRLGDPQALAAAQALQQLGEQLSQSADSPLLDFGQALAAGDVNGAAQALSQLDPAQALSGQDPQAADALAEQLESAASALQNANPAATQAMNTAAQVLRAGDAEAARQALDQASQSLADSAQAIAQANAAQAAAREIAQNQARLLQNGPVQSADSQPNGAAGSGNGQNGAAQNGAAQSSGSTAQNQDGAAGGAGRGEGASQGDGAQAGSTPIDQNNGPGDGGERAYEPIFAPTRLGPGGGQDLQLPGSDLPGDLSNGSGAAGLPDRSQASTVPYNDVFPAYQQTYQQAMDSGQVPAHLRDLVRQYFSALEP